MHKSAVMSHCKARCGETLQSLRCELHKWPTSLTLFMLLLLLCGRVPVFYKPCQPGSCSLLRSVFGVWTFLHFFVLFVMSSQFLQSHTNATTKVEVEATTYLLLGQIWGPQHCFCSDFDFPERDALMTHRVTPVTSNEWQAVWWLNCSKYKNAHAAERQQTITLTKHPYSLSLASVAFLGFLLEIIPSSSSAVFFSLIPFCIRKPGNTLTLCKWTNQLLPLGAWMELMWTSNWVWALLQLPSTPQRRCSETSNCS